VAEAANPNPAPDHRSALPTGAGRQPWDLDALVASPPADVAALLPAGAQLVITSEMRLLASFAHDIFEEGGMTIAVEGAPGCGKTTALDAVAAIADARTVYLSVPSETTSTTLPTLLCEKLRLSEQGSGMTMLRRARASLRQERTILIVDEAQFLPAKGLLQLRWLKKETGFNIGLIVAGAGVLKRLADLTTLRLDRRVELPASSAKHMQPHLLEFHPAFAEFPLEVLEWVNREHVNGRWFEWKAWLSAAIKLGLPSETGTDVVELARDALYQVTSRVVTTSPRRRAA
jgi:hypothetical protein